MSFFPAPVELSAGALVLDRLPSESWTTKTKEIDFIALFRQLGTIIILYFCVNLYQTTMTTSKDYQFMVDFKLPDTLSEEFMSLIPYQRAIINKFFREGKILNYALSLESSRLWAVFNADSELEVMEMLSDLPLTEYMQVEISILTFYNSMEPMMPNFSMN